MTDKTKHREPASIVLEALLCGVEVTEPDTGYVYAMSEDFDICQRMQYDNGEVVWAPLHAPVAWLIHMANRIGFDDLFIISANTVLAKSVGNKRVTR